MAAPQYPYGLRVTTWFFGVTGDVHEVDELNHYIGFMPLASIAHTERALAYMLGPAILLALLAAAAVRDRLGALLATPAIGLPVAFVIDLAAWLFFAGHHLDPRAALSSSVAPWTPSLVGPGGVGQFHTQSSFGLGFYFAVSAAVVAAAGVRARRAERRVERGW